MTTEYLMRATYLGSTTIHWVSPGAPDLSGSLSGFNPNDLTSIAVDTVTELNSPVTVGTAVLSAAGGDLSGYYNNPSVVKIRGYSIGTNIPQENDVLTWDGSEWNPMPPTGGNGGSASPIGNAAGDLSGKYPDPFVTKLNGTDIPTSNGTVTGQTLALAFNDEYFNQPYGIATDGYYVWISEANQQALEKHHIASTTTRKIDLTIPLDGTGFIRKLHINTALSPYLFAACMNSGRVLIIDRGTDQVIGIGLAEDSPGVFRQLRSITIDNLGNIWATNRNTGSAFAHRFIISDLIANYPNPVPFASVVALTNYAEEITFDGANIWVAGTNYGVERINPAGNGSLTGSQALSNAFDIISEQGKIYVLRNNPKEIHQFNPGAFPSASEDSLGFSATAVKKIIAANGYLWVPDAGNASNAPIKQYSINPLTEVNGFQSGNDVQGFLDAAVDPYTQEIWLTKYQGDYPYGIRGFNPTITGFDRSVDPPNRFIYTTDTSEIIFRPGVNTIHPVYGNWKDVAQFIATINAPLTIYGDPILNDLLIDNSFGNIIDCKSLVTLANYNPDLTANWIISDDVQLLNLAGLDGHEGYSNISFSGNYSSRPPLEWSFPNSNSYFKMRRADIFSNNTPNYAFIISSNDNKHLFLNMEESYLEENIANITGNGSIFINATKGSYVYSNSVIGSNGNVQINYDRTFNMFNNPIFPAFGNIGSVSFEGFYNDTDYISTNNIIISGYVVKLNELVHVSSIGGAFDINDYQGNNDIPNGSKFTVKFVAKSSNPVHFVPTGGRTVGGQASYTMYPVIGEEAFTFIYNYENQNWDVLPHILSASPSGTASGDLSKNYPSPRVVKINGVSVDTPALATPGNTLVAEADGTYFSDPMGIATDGTYIWTTNHSNAILVKTEISTKISTRIDLSSYSNNFIRSLHVNTTLSPYLFVGTFDGNNSKLLVLDRETNQVVGVGIGSAGIRSLCLDNLGNIWVGQQSDQSIRRFIINDILSNNPNPVAHQNTVSLFNSQAENMVFDGTYIWVAEVTSGISKIDVSGNGSFIDHQAFSGTKSVIYQNNYVWVLTSNNGGEIFKVDPATFPSGSPLDSITLTGINFIRGFTFANNSFWVPDTDGNNPNIIQVSIDPLTQVNAYGSSYAGDFGFFDIIRDPLNPDEIYVALNNANDTNNLGIRGFDVTSLLYNFTINAPIKLVYGSVGSTGTINTFASGNTGTTVATDTYVVVNTQDAVYNGNYNEFSLNLTSPSTAQHKLLVFITNGWNDNYKIRFYPDSGNIYEYGQTQSEPTSNNENRGFVEFFWDGTDWYIIRRVPGFSAP